MPRGAELGPDMEGYLILGACIPPPAHQALEADRSIGLLLPAPRRPPTPGAISVAAGDTGAVNTVPDPSEGHAAFRVLVAYAGVAGSTRSIAERITDCLEERGFRAEARSVGGVDHPDEYDAFVVGSAVHDMAWLPEALTFAHRHAQLLNERGVWLFSVGMPAALRGPWKALAGKEERHVIGELADALRPRGHQLFSGVIEPDHLSRAGRMKFQAMGLRYGDYRDWPAVDAWARSIGDQILGQGDTPL
ncbi:flavodoxin domain-containing protein [Streptomyces sp. L2]|uniref:flavodoxin domain-containing protein n=1 Tax=Streptomyces sp. L2 TaxID=2162665 RepID=UPI00240D5558|nr:flavodoxin domain-containing protein [Streptomyces sp. L2]